MRFRVDSSCRETESNGFDQAELQLAGIGTVTVMGPPNCGQRRRQRACARRFWTSLIGPIMHSRSLDMVIHQQDIITRAGVPTRTPAELTTTSGAMGRERVARPAIWSGGADGELIAGHIDGLHITDATIVNPLSTESATRMTNGAGRGTWRLSWLPEMTLTRTQVLSAMVLERILIAHDLDSATMMRIMRILADDLRMPLHLLLGRLSSHQQRTDTLPHSTGGSAMRTAPHRGDSAMRTA
ncbi:hypothetical protein [Nocardia jiangxiensis]|uniref:hypothetical protein n=1 Tax=Nocardia jiangxiensis TaxID=282685 RepID=UPI00146C4E59|nr:hypothetical protein [Nocardia jiangxiensis]